MADGTSIEWTDMTWNPITGCAVVSPGCTNCYAMKLAGTRLKNHPSRAGLTRDTKAGPVWTGEIRFNEGWLDQPFRKRRPRMIFVCAHGDLFAEGVTDEMLDRIFAVMALATQHTFQVLTKRPERMRAYLRSRAFDWHAVWPDANPPGSLPMTRQTQRFAMQGVPGRPAVTKFPLPNVWLGVSAEDQRRADERVPILLDTPAAVRWVSAEPLLGPIDFEAAWHGEDALDSECWGDCAWCKNGHPPLHNCQSGRQAQTEWDRGRSGLDWIVVGGESGHGARPMHPDWARTIRDQCAESGVPFLFKQWGEWAPVSMEAEADGEPGPAYPVPGCSPEEAHEGDHRVLFWQGDSLVFWPHVEVLPAIGARQIGKKAAGRLLDGVTHDAYPQCDEVLF